jgi:hypothetical protein
MIVRSVIGPVVCVIVAVMAWAIGTKYVQQSNLAPVERAMQAMRQLPMLQAVLADHPELETTLRTTVEANLHDLARGDSQATDRWAADVWRQYIVPALGNADDAPVLKVTVRFREFLIHLQSHDEATCREIGLADVQRLYKVDGRARALRRRLLEAFAEAYRSGTAHQPVRPRPSDNEVLRVVAEAGYSVDELAKLDSFDKLAGAERCAAMVRLLSALEALPPNRGATAVRYMLTAKP